MRPKSENVIVKDKEFVLRDKISEIQKSLRLPPNMSDVIRYAVDELHQKLVKPSK